MCECFLFLFVVRNGSGGGLGGFEIESCRGDWRNGGSCSRRHAGFADVEGGSGLNPITWGEWELCFLFAIAFAGKRRKLTEKEKNLDLLFYGMRFSFWIENMGVKILSFVDFSYST